MNFIVKYWVKGKRAVVSFIKKWMCVYFYFHPKWGLVFCMCFHIWGFFFPCFQLAFLPEFSHSCYIPWFVSLSCHIPWWSGVLLIPLFSARSLSLSTFTAKDSNSFFLSLRLLQGFLLKAGCCEIWDFIYHSSIASTVLQKSENVRKMGKSCTSRFHTSSFLCKNWFSSCEQKKKKK